MAAGETSRPHVSARVEDAINRALATLLTRRGWTPKVSASIAYGSPGRVRVFARVLFSPPGEQPTRSRVRARPAAPRGWRSLVALPAVGCDVTVTVGGASHSLQADRGGYVHADVPADLPPGWHSGTIEVVGRAPVTCRIRIVDLHARRGVVSDIDDTVLVTWVPRPLLAAWNTFFLREHARRPVPGMSELLRELAGDDGFIVYLSTGAWNFAPHLERFLTEHEFPPGPMFLTDWGPTSSGWFRSGAAHKRESLDRLRREHPHVTWILVGDDGQRDPAIYGEFAAAHPQVVTAIAIRRLTAAQQVLATGTPGAAVPSDHPGCPDAPGVPWVTGANGFELRVALSAAGVIPERPASASAGTVLHGDHSQ